MGEYLNTNQPDYALLIKALPGVGKQRRQSQSRRTRRFQGGAFCMPAPGTTFTPT
jgi:hypothetical protein